MRESDQKWQGISFIAVLMRFIEAPMVIDDAFPCALYSQAVERRLRRENAYRSTVLFSFVLSQVRLYSTDSAMLACS